MNVILELNVAVTSFEFLVFFYSIPIKFINLKYMNETSLQLNWLENGNET